MAKRPVPGLDVPVVDVKTGQMTQIWYEFFKQLSSLVAVALYTPVLTSVGGTLPTFSSLRGAYSVIGSRCFVNISALNSAGGTPGAGNNALSLSLPVPVSMLIPTAWEAFGSATNNNKDETIFGRFLAGARTAQLFTDTVSGNKVNKATLNCQDFDNASRALTLQFSYLIDP